MKAILLKVILSIFFIAFIASCDDPVKPAETPTPNPALLKYKSVSISINNIQRGHYDSVYRWDNSLKKGESRIEGDTSEFVMNFSSQIFELSQSGKEGKLWVEGNSILFAFDTLWVSATNTAYRSEKVKLTFDSTLTTLINCTFTHSDSLIGEGTTLDGDTYVHRFHYRTNTGVIKNLKKQSEGLFLLKGQDLQNAISGFNIPALSTSEYKEGGYSKRFTTFSNFILTDASEVKVELKE